MQVGREYKPFINPQNREDINMLDVSHVTKKYGKVVACSDLSFHLDPGSVTVLLGPNGAGKSTIMKSIIGFLRYDGEITVGVNSACHQVFPSLSSDVFRANAN